MTPAEFVIKRLGGLTAAGRAIEVPVTTVQGWKERGRIPQDHWQKIVDAAESAGKPIELRDFLVDHEDEGAEAAA